jgi:orotidine-5'-phosphate decarboxylase
MYTMHIAGGEEMMQRALEAAQKTAQSTGLRRPLALGITVLTSEDSGDNIQLLVLKRALLAKKVGLDGVVASAKEAAMLRKELGKDFVIVTPGIRPAGADAGDQKRVETPASAIAAGSSFLVVGRPIVKAADPRSAAESILKEKRGVLDLIASKLIEVETLEQKEYNELITANGIIPKKKEDIKIFAYFMKI